MVIDTDGSAFITKAEFDSLKNNFQAQIDNYNTSIDSKIDGAIAAYLAGIKISSTQQIEPTYVVPSIIGMSGSNNQILERTKTDYLNINCISSCVWNGDETRYYGIMSNELQTTSGKDTKYKCRLVDSILNTNATTKKHARWLGYQKGEMLVSGTLTNTTGNTFTDNGKYWSAESNGPTGVWNLEMGWGFAVCHGTSTENWGGFWVSDPAGYDKDKATMINQTARPFGNATDHLRNFPHLFAKWTSRAHEYNIINKPYVTQFDTNTPKVENKSGYDWFCNDGGDKDWTATYTPFTITNRWRGQSKNGSTSAYNLWYGGSYSTSNISLKVDTYPTAWSGHFWGCPYKGYNENITTMDDLYDTDYTTFIPNLNSTNNCKSSEIYNVNGQQVWCQSMGFPLTKITKDGTLEIEFNRNAGADNYVVRLCKGAQSKDYAYNTDIPYTIKTDLNGTPYDNKFGGFVLTGSAKKIKFDVSQGDILTLKVIPLNASKTDFEGYIELKPIQSMMMELAA